MRNIKLNYTCRVAFPVAFPTCNLSISAVVGMTTLVLCVDSTSLSVCSCLRTLFIMSWVEFHLIGASWISHSTFSPCSSCCCANYEALAGLCLKCPTTFLHLASAWSNGLFWRDTVIVRWRLCAEQGTWSKGSCLAAAIIFLALSVVSVLTLFSTVHSSATSIKCSAHVSA